MTRGVPGRPSRPRWGAVLAAMAGALLAVAVLVVGPAAPAGAHATLVRTDPLEGAVLAEAPEEIRFTFDESVSAVPDGVQVFDAVGAQQPASAQATGEELVVRPTNALGEGTHVVVWRAVSADGHPISGSLSFSVGAPSDTVSTAISGGSAESAETTGPPRALTVARWVGYVGLLLVGGLAIFSVLILPGSHLADGARRRLVSATRAAAATAAVGWLVALPVSAVYQVGGGASDLTEGSTWSALPITELVVAGSVVGGVVLTVVLLGHGSPPRRRGVATLVAAAVATGAPAATGHTRAAPPEALAIATDVLHLAAGSIWLGGLVALALVLPDLAGRGTLGGEVLARFSAVAAGILAALVLTGALLTWRIVGSWSALVESGYGQLLLVKILLALVAAAIAAWNRWSLLPRLDRASRRRERRAAALPIARATGVEAVALAAVLLVTGMLVDKSPEAEASVAEGVRTAVASGRVGPVEVTATLSPAVIGSATLTIEMEDAAGEPFEGYDRPRARLSSDQVDLGGVRLKSAAPGTYAADVVIPEPGTWRLQFSLRLTEFENPVTELELDVVG